MARTKSIIVMWLYLLLLKVKRDAATNVNMDTSALFHLDKGGLDLANSVVGDEDVDIVLTVGDLVKMYNNEDTSANKDSDILSPAKKKFERIEVIEDSKQTQSEITVDFRAVAGR